MIGQIVSHYGIVEKLAVALKVCYGFPFTSAMKRIPLEDQEA
jgi:hypothetical protein